MGPKPGGFCKATEFSSRYLEIFDFRLGEQDPAWKLRREKDLAFVFVCNFNFRAKAIIAWLSLA